MIDKNYVYKSLDVSEQQVEDGKVVDAQECLNDLKVKYGLCDENNKMTKG